jgi:hypothetical protein
MARVLADHPHHAFAADYLAVAAQLFHRSPDFHFKLLLQLSAISIQPSALVTAAKPRVFQLKADR